MNMDENSAEDVMGPTEVSAFADYENSTDIEQSN